MRAWAVLTCFCAADSRKRHLLVDTLGLVLVGIVHSASVQDRAGAKLVLTGIHQRFPLLGLVWDRASPMPLASRWPASPTNSPSRSRASMEPAISRIACDASSTMHLH
jgi:hypothetical protein